MKSERRREMREKSVVVAKGSRLREEPKRETREKVDCKQFFHTRDRKTTKERTRDPWPPVSKTIQHHDSCPQ